MLLQAEEMENQVQRYNVLCVTKLESTDSSSEVKPYVPITGMAELATSYKEELGVRIAKTVVRFQGRESELLYVRPGISGSAVTLAIKQSGDYPYRVWELYTDTPADARYSVEEVREFTRRTIAHASGNRR